MAPAAKQLRSRGFQNVNELCDRLAQAFFALTDDSVGGNGSAVGDGSPRRENPSLREAGGRNRLGAAAAQPSFGIDRDALLSHSRTCPRCQSIGVALAAAPSVTRARTTSTPHAGPPPRVWASIEASLRTEGIIRDASRS